MQSRRWREEPDLMAIDKNGSLFIFELKAWEPESITVSEARCLGLMLIAEKRLKNTFTKMD
jgi:hypothetical protein